MNDLSKEQLEHINTAMYRIGTIAHRDCDCLIEDGVPTDDSTSCDTCQAKLALCELHRAVTPVLEGLHPNRMMGFPERIFVEKWRRENERATNGRTDQTHLLRLLLTPEGSKDYVEITQRDANVATTIIQWLGTNCGLCFIHQCEQAIAQEKKLTNVVGIGGVPAHCGVHMLPENEERREVARHLAQQYVSVDKHPHAAHALENGILSAILKFTDRKVEEHVAN